MKLIQKCLGLVLFSFLLSSIALAQQSDPFLSDTEGDGSYATEIKQTREKADDSLGYHGARAELPRIEEALQKKADFRGPIERLLKSAGEDPAAAQNDWQDFEELKPEDKEKYMETPEWKVRRELSQPYQRRDPFGDKLGNIEQTLGELGKQEKDLEQQYGDRSKYAPGYNKTTRDRSY